MANNLASKFHKARIEAQRLARLKPGKAGPAPQSADKLEKDLAKANSRSAI